MRHTGDMRTYYRLVVSDQHGRVTKRTGWRLCRSWVQQWIQGHRIFFASTTEANVEDTTPVTQTLRDPNLVAQTFASLSGGGAPADSDLIGMMIGTGGAAVAIGDSNLAAQILDGAAAGEMEHQPITVGSIAVVGGVATFLASRAFINLSGGQIVVAEFGLVSNGLAVAGNRFFLVAREVPSATIPVDDLSTITVQATVRISV